MTNLDPCEQRGKRTLYRSDVTRLCVVSCGVEEPRESPEREQGEEQLHESRRRPACAVREDHPRAEKDAHDHRHQCRQLVLRVAGDHRDEDCERARDTQLDGMLGRSGSVRSFYSVEQAHPPPPWVLRGVGGDWASRSPGGSSIVTDPDRLSMPRAVPAPDANGSDPYGTARASLRPASRAPVTSARRSPVGSWVASITGR